MIQHMILHNLSTVNNNIPSHPHTHTSQSLYSDLEEVGDSGPSSFFEETESFWAPAGDCASLYQQLANRKYREILRNQIE